MKLFIDPICGILLLLMLHLGCIQTQYAIDVRVDGERLHRTLTITPNETPTEGDVGLDPGQQERLEAIYGAAVLIDGANVVFEGQFDGDPPADLGGLGRHAVYDSPLGQCHLYSERIGDPIDLAEHSRQWQQGVERLIEMTVQWVRFELGDTPSANRLADFVGGEMADDVREIAQWWLVASSVHSIDGVFVLNEKGDADTIWPTGPVMQLLLERDWLAVTDLPTLAEWMATGDSDAFGDWLWGRIAEKAGLSDDSILQAELFSDQDQLKASVDRFLRTTPEYAQALKDWQRTYGDSREGQPEGNAAIKQLGLFEHCSVVLGGNPIKFTLHCDRRPVGTNGRWDEITRQISWSGNRDATFLPMIISAVWVVPDVDVNLPAHPIADPDLVKFCLLYQSLQPSQRADWDKAIEVALKSGLWRGPTDKKAAEVYQTMSSLVEAGW